MDNDSIGHNLSQVNKTIKSAVNKVGRSLDGVRLVAVSKYIDLPLILKAYEAEHRHFGENRVQELQNKVNNLPPDIQWHLIGHLQSNKVRPAVKYSSLIHSVDSFRLLKKINQAAEELKKVQNILLQANISEEKTKFGTTLSTVEELLKNASTMEFLNCKGFMTMAPLKGSEDEVRKVFRRLRIFRDEMQQKYQLSLPELSMGMSSDYKIAIEEGATLIRVGSAIFGSRSVPA